MLHSTSSPEDRALQANTPPASSFQDARAYDPAEPPRFGEWVRVEGWVDEEDRPTRREEPRATRSRLVLWAALVLGALAIAALTLWRLQAPPAPAKIPASPTHSLSPQRPLPKAKATSGATAVSISREGKTTLTHTSVTVAPTLVARPVVVKPVVAKTRISPLRTQPNRSEAVKPNTRAPRSKMSKPIGANLLPPLQASKP